MADRKQDLLGRLADLSEASIQKLAETPAADRALQALKGLGDRVDELQRRTRGFEELEKRLAKLEKKVDAMGKPKTSGRAASGSRARTAKSSTAKASAAKKP